jgi:serine O-acetyltransferase
MTLPPSTPEPFGPENLWTELRKEAELLAATSPMLRASLREHILECLSLPDALAHLLAQGLKSVAPEGCSLAPLFRQVLGCADIQEAACADLAKLNAVNPACPSLLAGFLSFRGFQALQLYRIANSLWVDGQHELAVLLQNWGALKYAIDIHPAARIGQSVFIDHGMGLVIGSTAVVEDGVNIWHGVTLGSTLMEAGDRHPKVRRNATLCAGATILGNIEIGEGSIVAASSVVLAPVEAGAIAAGIPARIVGRAGGRMHAIDAGSKSTSVQIQETLHG